MPGAVRWGVLSGGHWGAGNEVNPCIPWPLALHDPALGLPALPDWLLFAVSSWEASAPLQLRGNQPGFHPAPLATSGVTLSSLSLSFLICKMESCGLVVKTK